LNWFLLFALFHFLILFLSPLVRAACPSPSPHSQVDGAVKRKDTSSKISIHVRGKNVTTTRNLFATMNRAVEYEELNVFLSVFAFFCKLKKKYFIYFVRCFDYSFATLL
jgi:hypothetical protein